MVELIQSKQLAGHSIILSLDANEAMHKRASGIARLSQLCGLVDVHKHLFPDSEVPSHRKGTEKIDFMLISMDLLPCITAAGILEFDAGFHSDHRTMFLDLDIQKFFRGISDDPVSAKTRAFTSANYKRLKQVRAHIQSEWERRNITLRLQRISQISQLPTQSIRRDRLLSMWEKIDRELGLIFLGAEASLKTPKKTKYMWSPTLALAGATKRYWRSRLANAAAGIAGTFLSKRGNHNPSIIDDGTTDVTELQRRYDQATIAYAAAAKCDVELRNNHLETLMHSLSNDPNPAAQDELKSLQAIQRKERQTRLFNKLRNTLHPLRSGSISQVDVPKALLNHLNQDEQATRVTSENNEELQSILNHTIKNKRSASEEWVTVIDKRTLETAVLLYCQQHFRQASTTPLGSGQLAELIGNAGLTEECTNILNGMIPEAIKSATQPELSAFIAHMAIPEDLRDAPLISTEISAGEFTSSIKKWKESTSTSPSGRHLGYYRATLDLGSITQDMCELLNIVTRCGLVPTRWCKAVSVLLEKDAGTPTINRLRVIHLFEADYNLFLKLLWAQRLVRRGEDNRMFGEAQQGSRRGRMANDAVLLKRLTYDLTRITKSNLGTFDNDAKSCYDRIINGLAMLAARKFGMPTLAVQTHAGVLAAMEYSLKTSFGISELSIQSTPSSFLFGTGQGSGASPSVWLTISTTLLQALKSLIPRGMVFQSPDGLISVERYSDAFVDDTQNGTNDAHCSQSWTLDELIERLQAMAQTWERLLHCSGGALELTKCSYYLLSWKWTNGIPNLLTLQETQAGAPITLKSGTSNKPIPIHQLAPSEAHKTLGVWLAPDGNEKAQVDYLLSKSHQIAILISQSNFTRLEAHMAYHLCWIPAVTYSFGISTIPDSALLTIQSHPTMNFLQKMGFNQNFPRAISFGPQELGGLALRNLPVEQGIARISTFLEHVYNDSETGKLILISLHSLQLEAGTKSHLLADPLPKMSYLTQCWISALRDFLRQHQTQIHVTDAWNFTLPRVNDKFLMDKF